MVNYVATYMHEVSLMCIGLVQACPNHFDILLLITVQEAACIIIVTDIYLD